VLVLVLALVLPALAGVRAWAAGGDPHAVSIVRTQAPQITLTGHPRARTRGRTTVIPFQAHGQPGSVSCRLDGGRVRACRSPVRLRALRVGPHRLQLRAANRFGSVTITILWTVPETARSPVVSTPVAVSPPELYPPSS
jgi:hypothetical protein